MIRSICASRLRNIRGKKLPRRLFCSAKESSKPVDESIVLAKWFQLNEDGLKAFQEKKYDSARGYLSAALELRAGKRDVCYATSLYNLATLKKREKNSVGLMDMFEESIEILEEHKDVPRVSRILANCYLEFGLLLQEKNIFKETKPLFEKAIYLLKSDICKDMPGSKECLARCEFAYASTSMALKDLESAENLFESSLESSRELYGENHWNVAEIYRSIGVLKAEKGNIEDTQLSYLKCLEILCNIQSAHVSVVIDEYAALLKRLGADHTGFEDELVRNFHEKQNSVASK